MKNVINARRVKYWLVIIAYVILTLLLVGYRFGDGDQNSHIPFLQKNINTELYPNNSFVELRNNHFSFFWMAITPILKTNLLPMEIVFFLIFVVCLILLFDAYYRLINIFIRNNKISLICLSIFVLPVFSFTIFPTHENYLVDRVFVFPLLIYSITFFLKNEYWKSFLLLGIVYNLHPLSATFVLAMFVLSMFYEFIRKRLNIKKIAIYLVLFIGSALPVLGWKFGSSGLDLSIHRGWYESVSRGVLWQVFHLFSVDPPVVFLSILGLGNSFVLLWIIGKKYESIFLRGKLIMFVLSIYIVLLLGVLAYEFLPITVAVQFQLTRIGIFIPVLAYPLFIGFIYDKFKKLAISKKYFITLVLITAVSGWLVVPWLYYLFLIKKKILQARILFGINTILLLIGLWVTYSYSIWKPGIFIYPIKNDWYDVQIWAKNNSNIGDVFVTPVDKWTHYYSDFIVFSERSNVVTLGELFEIAFHPDYLDVWKVRFEDVVPGAIEKFSTNFDTNRKLVANIYNENSTEDFMRITKKYNANYVIVEKPKKLDMQIIYENEGYRVYKTQ